MKWFLSAVAIVLIGLGVAFMLILVPTTSPLDHATTTPATTTPATTTPSGGSNEGSTTPSTDLSDLIVVTSPKSGATIGAGGTGTSTLTVTGKARGSFYFEAVFPVYLTDWDGRIIAQGQAHAQGDWMTSDFVPFTATISFKTPQAGDPSVNRGTLILHNDNPSGDPSRDKALEIPVVFK